MNILDLLQAVQYKSPEELTADEFDAYLRAALRFYNRYNPILDETSFETVAGTAEYELDVEPLYIRYVLWSPAGDLEVLDLNDYYEELSLDTLPVRSMPSLRVIQNIEREAMYKELLGRWELRGKVIVLIPTPETSGLTVTVGYAVGHEIDGAEISTIPDEDFDILRDLVLAEVIESKGFQNTTLPDYSVGLTRVTRHFAGELATKLAQRLRERAVAKYERAVASAGV